MSVDFDPNFLRAADRVREINASILANAEPGDFYFLLTDDQAHWEAAGIVTAADLDDYLDREHQREMRKAMMYDQWDDLMNDDAYRADWERDQEEIAARDAEHGEWMTPDDEQYYGFERIHIH